MGNKPSSSFNNRVTEYEDKGLSRTQALVKAYKETQNSHTIKARFLFQVILDKCSKNTVTIQDFLDFYEDIKDLYNDDCGLLVLVSYMDQLFPQRFNLVAYIMFDQNHIELYDSKYFVPKDVKIQYDEKCFLRLLAKMKPQYLTAKFFISLFEDIHSYIKCLQAGRYKILDENKPVLENLVGSFVYVRESDWISVLPVVLRIDDEFGHYMLIKKRIPPIKNDYDRPFLDDEWEII
jgi:hypothetical protein